MHSPPKATPASSARSADRHSGPWIVFALTFLFVLAAVVVSTGLLVYTAWHRELENGLFALAFAVLSARAALSWFLWRSSDRQPPAGYRKISGSDLPTD